LLPAFEAGLCNECRAELEPIVVYSPLAAAVDKNAKANEMNPGTSLLQTWNAAMSHRPTRNA
jgi:hypothetical protein